jgi:hypothetical protein
MNQENLKLWKNRLTEFGRLNNAIPEFVKRPSLGSSIEYYYSSMQIPFGLNKIEFSQGAHVQSDNVRYSKISFSYNFENNRSLEIGLNRSDFFDFLFSKKIIKTGSKDFDKAFAIRTNDVKIALSIFSDQTIQDLFMNNKSLIFNLQTSKSRVTTVLLKDINPKLYPLAELTELLKRFAFILRKLGN